MPDTLATKLEQFLVLKVGLQCSNLREMLRELRAPALVDESPSSLAAARRVEDMLLDLEKTATDLSEQLFSSAPEQPTSIASDVSLESVLRRLAS